MDYEVMMNGNVKIGERAPEIEAKTTMGDLKLSDYKGKWVVLFSHPGDFTPVCTTEIIAFARANTYSDPSGAVARKYGMISNDVSTTETVRNVFIINPKGIVRTILVYPMDVGRCIPEILRTVEALQIAEKCNGATPANWVKGNPIIQKSPQTFNGLQERVREIEKDRNGMSWYLSFKDSENCGCDINENDKREIKEEKIEDKKIK